MLDILLSIIPYIFFSGQQQLLIRKKVTTKDIVISYGIYHSQSALQVCKRQELLNLNHKFHFPESK